LYKKKNKGKNRKKEMSVRWYVKASRLTRGKKKACAREMEKKQRWVGHDLLDTKKRGTFALAIITRNRGGSDSELVTRSPD